MENSLLKHLSGLHGMVDRNLVAFIVGDVDLARKICKVQQFFSKLKMNLIQINLPKIFEKFAAMKMMRL